MADQDRIIDREKNGTINVLMWREKRKIDVSFHVGDRVIDILRRLDSPVDGTLVFNDDDPLPLDMDVRGSMNLKIISVASGG